MVNLTYIVARSVRYAHFQNESEYYCGRDGDVWVDGSDIEEMKAASTVMKHSVRGNVKHLKGLLTPSPCP